MRDASATAELPEINPRCEDTRLDATCKYYVDSNPEEESRHRSQLGEDEGGEARTGTGGQPTSLPLPEGKETVPPALQKEQQHAEKQNACSTSCTLQKRQQLARGRTTGARDLREARSSAPNACGAQSGQMDAMPSHPMHDTSPEAAAQDAAASLLTEHRGAPTSHEPSNVLPTHRVLVRVEFSTTTTRGGGPRED